jgi:hypothetical protein
LTFPRPPYSPARDEQAGLYVVPRQRVSEDPAIRCRAIIYGFPIYDFDPRTGLKRPPVRDPQTGELRYRIRIDYVGQTIRRLETRTGEHLEDKPWADLVAGDPVVLAEGEWTKAERDAAEVAEINRLRPRLNHDENLWNRERIPLPEQLTHRWARDDAAGLPRWIPLEQRTEQARLAAMAAVIGAGLDGNEPRYPLTVVGEVLCALGRFVASWPRRLQLAAVAAVLWGAGVWAANAQLVGHGLPEDVALVLAIALCSIVLGALLRGKRLRRWARRRRRR